MSCHTKSCTWCLGHNNLHNVSKFKLCGLDYYLLAKKPLRKHFDQNNITSLDVTIKSFYCTHFEFVGLINEGLTVEAACCVRDEEDLRDENDLALPRDTLTISTV